MIRNDRVGPRPRQRSALVGTLMALLVASAILLVAGIPRAEAAPLYAATGSHGVNGELVILNPATGAVLTDVGPLVDGAAHHYGLTGLAFQPGTGVLFGSTAVKSPTAPGHLITINPATATVTDVGPFNIGFNSGRPNTMSDITFDPTSGILYGNSGQTPDFYTINLTTGAATSLGLTGQGGTVGGGLAANAAGTIFGTPDGAGAHLFTYNKSTGHATSVATLSGAPLFNGVINSLAFDGQGTLFGINNNSDNPSLTHLVTINTTTAVVTDVGASLDNLDALAFQGAGAGGPVPTLSEWGQILLVGLLLATGVWMLRRRRLVGA